MKTKVIISVIALLLCIATTVGLRIAINRADTAYDEVKVTVVSSETKTKKVLTRWQTFYEVIVSYEGENCELKNTHGTYDYLPGLEVTAFLSGGELYANIEGVKSSTPLARVHFIFIFVNFAMVIVTLNVVSQARRRI